MEDYTLVKVVGEPVKIMCEVNEKYSEYVTLEKGKQVLYLKLKKAL